MEAWQERLPSPLSKGGNGCGGAFHHRGGAGKFLGGRRIFARIPQTCPKSLMCNFAYKFSPTKIMKTFFGVTSTKWSSCVFSANLGYHFLKSNNAGRHLYPDFQGFFSDFHKNQNFYGCACTTSTPTSNTTTLHNSLIGNFMANRN